MPEYKVGVRVRRLSKASSLTPLKLESSDVSSWPEHLLLSTSLLYDHYTDFVPPPLGRWLSSVHYQTGPRVSEGI